METKAFLHTVRKNIKEIVKIKLYCDTPFPRWLTWRLVRNSIYMYDCGESYANVRMLTDIDELFKELCNCVTENTVSATIKYSDDSKDTYHFK